MFANHIAVTAAHVSQQAFGHMELQTARVQCTSTSKYTMRRKSAEFPGQIRHHVHRVRHHTQQGVRTVFQELWDDSYRQTAFATHNSKCTCV